MFKFNPKKWVSHRRLRRPLKSTHKAMYVETTRQSRNGIAYRKFKRVTVPVK